MFCMASGTITYVAHCPIKGGLAGMIKRGKLFNALRDDNINGSGEYAVISFSHP